MTHGNEKDFLEFARDTLDQSLKDIDAATASRLSRARAKALAGKQSRHGRWMPAGAAVAMAVTAVLVMVVFHGGPSGISQPPLMEDVDLLASDADLEMLRDMDFYGWLEEERDAG